MWLGLGCCEDDGCSLVGTWSIYDGQVLSYDDPHGMVMMMNEIDLFHHL